MYVKDINTNKIFKVYGFVKSKLNTLEAVVFDKDAGFTTIELYSNIIPLEYDMNYKAPLEYKHVDDKYHLFGGRGYLEPSDEDNHDSY